MDSKIAGILLLLLTNTSNQVPPVSQEWVSKYNGPANSADVVSSMKVDDQGNVYVTGFSSGVGTGYDYATIKYNSSGSELWVQRYTGEQSLDDKATAIAVDSVGNVYVTGWITLTTTELQDYVTIKYDSSGNKLWNKKYNSGPGCEDGATAIAVRGTDVFVTGSSVGSFTGTNHDYLTVNYNISGAETWTARYNYAFATQESPSSIIVDGTGIYVTGSGTTSKSGKTDYVTVKYSGNTQNWVARYDGPANDTDAATSMAVNGEDVYVTGYSEGSGTGMDFTTIKYRENVETWVQRYNGTGNADDIGNSITVDTSGNVYVTGKSRGVDSYYDYTTIKYSTDGIKEWEQRYNGTGNYNDSGNSIAIDSSRNVYVTGTSTEETGEECTTIKYNSSGVQQWIMHDKGQSIGCTAKSIALDSSGNVYVSGTSSENDYITIKYSQPNSDGQ